MPDFEKREESLRTARGILYPLVWTIAAYVGIAAAVWAVIR